VNNAALCDSLIESLAEPGDIDVVEPATLTNPNNPRGMSVAFSDGSFNILAFTPPDDTSSGVVINMSGGSSQVPAMSGLDELDFQQTPLRLFRWVKLRNIDEGSAATSSDIPTTEATPADIPVVPNVMDRIPDQSPELISSNSDVTWFSCFWSFFSE
jgi:hypothetical protein